MHPTDRRKVCKTFLIIGSLSCRRHFVASSYIIAQICELEPLFSKEDIVRLLHRGPILRAFYRHSTAQAETLTIRSISSWKRNGGTLLNVYSAPKRILSGLHIYPDL